MSDDVSRAMILIIFEAIKKALGIAKTAFSGVGQVIKWGANKAAHAKTSGEQSLKSLYKQSEQLTSVYIPIENLENAKILLKETGIDFAVASPDEILIVFVKKGETKQNQKQTDVKATKKTFDSELTTPKMDGASKVAASESKTVSLFFKTEDVSVVNIVLKNCIQVEVKPEEKQSLHKAISNAKKTSKEQNQKLNRKKALDPKHEHQPLLRRTK